MISKELSEKIKVGSFIATIMVVYRHSMTHEAFFSGWNETPSYYKTIASGITNLTGIAVPFFFLVSGFFFFRYSYYEKSLYINMIKKKARTLFIPFIFWNLVSIIPMYIGHKIPNNQPWFIYFINLLYSDFNPPLWYIRNLMIMMLFVLLYDWIFLIDREYSKKQNINIQHTLKMLLLATIFSYIIYIWYPMDTQIWSTEGWLFFLLGGIIYNHKTFLTYHLPNYLGLSLFLLWMVSCFTNNYTGWPNKIHLFLGLFLFWNILNKKLPSQFLHWTKYSFFIYVTHFVGVKVIKTCLAHIFYRNEIIALITYLILPIIVIPIILWIGKQWNKKFPKLFFFITGGRQ